MLALFTFFYVYSTLFCFKQKYACDKSHLYHCNKLLFVDKFYVFIDFPGHGFSSSIPVGFIYSIKFAVSLIERVSICKCLIDYGLVSHENSVYFVQVFSFQYQCIIGFS